MGVSKGICKFVKNNMLVNKLKQIDKWIEDSTWQSNPQGYMKLHAEAQTLLLQEILKCQEKQLEAQNWQHAQKQASVAKSHTGAAIASNHSTGGKG